MKILVMSDSHGRADRVERLISEVKPELALHLGDCVADTAGIRERFPELDFYSVRGNCDPRSAGEVMRIVEAAGLKIFMTHGHEYGVKFCHDKAVNAACVTGSDVLLFGHTHAPYYREDYGLHIMNPGALCDGRYGIIEITDGGINCRLEKTE